MHKSIEPEEMHPQILRKMTDEVAKPLSILSEQLWQASEVPSSWKRGNKIPTFKKEKKEDPGNTGQPHFAFVLGKIMEEILQDTMLRYMKKKVVIADSQHGFTTGKLCLVNLVAF